jgi:hypothetical protein
MLAPSPRLESRIWIRGIDMPPLGTRKVDFSTVGVKVLANSWCQATGNGKGRGGILPRVQNTQISGSILIGVGRDMHGRYCGQR